LTNVIQLLPRLVVIVGGEALKVSVGFEHALALRQGALS
jgi:hypothetical protein